MITGTLLRYGVALVHVFDIVDLVVLGCHVIFVMGCWNFLHCVLVLISIIVA